MLIKEDLLKKLIKLKLEEQKINEDRAARQARRAARKERRAERQADRDADKFEKEDPGPKLKDVVKNDLVSTTDSTYEYVLSEVDRIMPMIEDIEQRFRGIRLIKVLKSRREKRFTIGQVKRFIKTGLEYTKAKDYFEAADEFCAAGAFLESPKTPENKVINVDRELIDTLYDLCQGLGKGGKFGKKTPKKGGGSSAPPPGGTTGIVEQIQETLNGCIKTELAPLKIDGKWGRMTTQYWRAVITTKLLPGSTINGVAVTDDIIRKVLESWPDGGPMLNYAGDPTGCLKFLKDLCKKKAEEDDPPGGGSTDDFRDCSWSDRRTSFTRANIPVGELLDISAGGAGLDINLVYDYDEFMKYYPDESFDDFTQLGHYYKIDDIKGMGMQYVERHPDGPDEHSSDMMIPADDYYYNCQTGELLFSTATGDGVLNDVIVVGDKLFYTRTPDVHVTMARNIVSETRYNQKKTVSEADVRKFIRGHLIREDKEGITIDTVSTLIGTVSDTINAMAEDEGIEAENLHTKIKRASASFNAGNMKQAKEMFNTAAEMAQQAALGQADAQKRKDLVNILKAISAGIDSPKATEAVKKLAKEVDKVKKGAASSGEAKKSKKKKGNDKVKQIQTLLNILNKDKPKLTIDGLWGKNTQAAYEKALKDNQKYYRGLLKTIAQSPSIPTKKWSEASKLLSARSEKFDANIDGMISFLQYVVPKKLEKESDVPEVDAETKAQLDALGMTT